MIADYYSRYSYKISKNMGMVDVADLGAVVSD